MILIVKEIFCQKMIVKCHQTMQVKLLLKIERKILIKDRKMIVIMLVFHKMFMVISERFS